MSEERGSFAHGLTRQIPGQTQPLEQGDYALGQLAWGLAESLANP